MPHAGRYLLMVGLVLAAAAAGCRPREGAVTGPVTDGKGGFSYDAPAGWEASRPVGIACTVVSGPMSGGSCPNIFTVIERSDEPVDEYVNSFLVRHRESYSGVTVLGRDTVTSASGETAVRVDTSRGKDGGIIRQKIHFFSSGDRKIVVTCTFSSEADPGVEELLDDAVLTFRIDKENK